MQQRRATGLGQSGFRQTRWILWTLSLVPWLSGETFLRADDAPQSAPAGAAAAATEPESRDRFNLDAAGNEEVKRVMRQFGGAGVRGDDSLPTPAAEAVSQFIIADDLQFELVAGEPEVEQPLDLHFDDRGRMWVVQYRQYPFPAGLKVLRYDQYLRAVFDKMPQAPPHHTPGADKITVFEDTDGDGRYDASKDVITGLNIASSVCTGKGGIWVLNPPYLLFYPDADGDDVPDGDPVVHLSGFGLEDTHSVANSLRWGPDGWLYAANGSTTTGNVSSSVTRNVRFEGQCIWRYHPETHVFEIYAEGGGNTFSTEIDSVGRVFSGTNYGNTRGMYYPQGSYGEKNWGKHGPLTNPYAFGYFTHMKHAGDTARFAQTFVIYEGGNLPQKYHGRVIAANALHNRVWVSDLSTDGSTYQTSDLPQIVTTPDRWFRPVDLEIGPDGAVYLADWYDTRLSHLDPRDNWHKTTGRIYRLSGRESADTDQTPSPEAGSSVSTDLRQLDDAALIDLFGSSNRWTRQTSVRVLGERMTLSPVEQTLTRLRELAVDPNASTALEALWALNWCGAADQELLVTLFAHPSAAMRRWAVRLIGDRRTAGMATITALATLATTEPDLQVRSQLASAARRLETSAALPILLSLSTRSEDVSDRHLPLQLWWAFESHAGEQPAVSPQLAVPLTRTNDAAPRTLLLQGLADPQVWDRPLMSQVVLPRLMRRLAQEAATTPATAAQAMEGGVASALESCARLLELAPNDDHRGRLLAGFLEAYQGRDVLNSPPSLRAAIADYQSRIGNSDVALGLKLRQPEAVQAALKIIANEKSDAGARLTYIGLLGQSGEQSVISPLLSLLGGSSPAVKRAAMQALMNFDDPRIGQTICSRYHSSLPDEHDLRSTAQRVLASRLNWTKQLLQEIDSYRIKPETIALDVVQQMRLHDDEEVRKKLDRYWGRTRATPEEKLQQIDRVRRLVTSAVDGGKTAIDPVAGRALFKQHCATCHTLFDEGGQTGPKLTGYERDNLEFLIPAIVDPSAGIREEFIQFQVITTNGLVLNGLLDDQTPTTVTLRGANNQSTVINRDEVDILQAVETSLMPEGLLEKLSDQEVRDLFAYLVRRTPLTEAVGGQ